MKWSLSGAKTFRRCQRQWFYRACLSNGVTKDPVRRNVYLLGKLQTISGWRGSIIDNVITTGVVPALQDDRMPDPVAVIARAKRLYDLQLATALDHPLRQPDRTVKSWGDAYAAFHSVEYGDGPSREELDRAWQEIETALRNLFGMTALLNRLRGASKLVVQRSLQYSCCGVTVVAVPDLIAFYADEPPAIVDWKAHIVGTMDASTQLAIYSIALKACQPHRDFPASLARWSVGSIRLVEVQLLLNRIRKHDLDDDDRNAVEAYVAESANSMLMAVNGKKSADLMVEDFSTAAFDGTCERCSFRKVCWENLQ
jgi:PD-(D/E)XK nuclease superfamily